MLKLALRHPARTVTKLKELVQMDIEHKSKRTFSIQQIPNGRTLIFYIFIGAGDSVILLEIAGAEENPKTKRRWYDRVKESVKYIGRNWGPLLFVLDLVLDKFCG